MKNDLLACRHIGISEKDEEKMLRKIGVGSLDELIDKTIPANIRLKEPLTTNICKTRNKAAERRQFPHGSTDCSEEGAITQEGHP